MSDVELRRQLLDLFQANYNSDIKLIDICRAVQQPKKVVNSVLYCLRNEGVLQKVVESPPVWRVNDKLISEKFMQLPGPVGGTPLCAIKDDNAVSALSAVTRNNNSVVLSSVENNRSDPSYVREQLVPYHTVVGSNAGEEISHNYTTSRQVTFKPNSVPSVNQMGHAAYLSRPAEAVLHILQKQKGALSCKSICSLLGYPEVTVTLALQQLLLLGLVCQDNNSMFWSTVSDKKLESSTDVVINIINYLKHANCAVHTKDLVKGVGLNSKKEINPILYKLQQKGFVVKVNESPPMWQLGEQVVDNMSVKAAKPNDLSLNGNWHDPPNCVQPVSVCTVEEIDVSMPAITGGVAEKSTVCAKCSSPSRASEVLPNCEEVSVSRDTQNGEAVTEKHGHKSAAKTASPEKLGNRKLHDVAEKHNSFPQQDTKLNSVNTPSTIKPEIPTSKSSNMVNNTSRSSSLESENANNQSRLFASHNTKSNAVENNSSRSNSSRKAASPAGKISTKAPEQNSAAHYVNDVLNSDSFAALMKNPVSALYEYGQRNHIDTKVEITMSEGPPHNPRFKAVAYMGEEELATAWDKTKKDARRQAAELAVRGLVANGGFGKFSSLTTTTESINELPPVISQFDMIAALSHKTFNERVLQVPEYMGGRKVLAALVMKNGISDTRGTVICLGTGNRCITGEGLSQDGLVVNDSHAEVITRRGFLRFMYKQLKTYKHDQDHTIFEKAEGSSKLQVKPHVTFHLYISTAPCGDGALFTHNLKPGEKVEPPDSTDSHHHPVFTKSLQGLLRSKMEAGEGTIPIDTQYQFQSWDAILRGEKLRTMSCSDKIARWNVLGLQGALLSHILKPIYLSSITLGNLYHHGHLSRAVCCRLVGEPELSELLPEGYFLNHPDLGRVIVCTPSRETEKTKPHSINWCLDDERPELTSGVNGTSDERSGGQTQSRLCKAVIFQSFKEISATFGLEHLAKLTYGEAKREAKEFQAAKDVLFERFQQLGRGTWIRKPEEEEEFM